MKPTIAFIAFYLAFSTTILAQQNYPNDTCWTANFNDGAKNASWSSKVVTDDSGNIIVLASGRLYNVLVKYSTAGDQLWIDSFANAYDLYPQDLIVDNENNIYIALRNWVILKYNPNNSLLWQTESDTGELNNIAVNSKGEVAAGGTDEPHDKYVIKKYGKNGFLEWSGTYDLFPNDAENPLVVIDEDGNIYLSGQEDDSDISYATTIKYNSSGNFQWKSRINEIEFTYTDAIALDDDGNVIVIAGGGDFFYDYLIAVLKYAPKGTLLWSDVTTNVSDHDVGVGIDNSNHIYVCYPSGVYDSILDKDIPSIGLTKYEPSGLIDWKEDYGEPEAHYFEPKAMTLNQNGSIIVVSQIFLDRDYKYDSVMMETLKFDSTGKVIWGQRFPIDSIQYEPNSVAIGKGGSIIVSASKTFPSGGELSTIDYCNCNDFPSVHLQIPDSSFCENENAYFLSGGSPPGGIYSGNGVTEGYFFPVIAGQGSHDITYTYATGSGCSDSASQNVTVAVCTSVLDTENDFLLQVEPNPFINNATLVITMPEISYAKIELRDISGKKIKTIASRLFSKGKHEIGINREALVNGIYFIELRTSKSIMIKKLVAQ